jgi:hypothetical protein
MLEVINNCVGEDIKLAVSYKHDSSVSIIIYYSQCRDPSFSSSTATTSTPADAAGATSPPSQNSFPKTTAANMALPTSSIACTPNWIQCQRIDWQAGKEKNDFRLPHSLRHILRWLRKRGINWLEICNIRHYRRSKLKSPPRNSRKAVLYCRSPASFSRNGRTIDEESD